jgi:hypothetical protein
MRDRFGMGRGGFRDCFPLHVQIDSGVFVGSIDAGMTEPVSDAGEINTGFKKMNRCAVAIIPCTG